jgi:hypothetical protein
LITPGSQLEILATASVHSVFPNTNGVFKAQFEILLNGLPIGGGVGFSITMLQGFNPDTLTGSGSVVVRLGGVSGAATFTLKVTVTGNPGAVNYPSDNISLYIQEMTV